MLEDFFSAGGPLDAVLPGFQPRPGQVWMAEAVAQAIRNRDKLVVEAGTGTGKTFAYLLPALVSGRKTIISTGTKALQDQLFHRDLPLVGKAIGRPVRTALLKGRANYLCLERLDRLDDVPTSLTRDAERVREWRHATGTGDRSELTDVAEDSGVWPYVTSTVDNCLGQKCPQYADCHVVSARREAQEAELVVINHHLLLADLAMKESGFVEFLPEADAIVLDEAHQIPDLAVRFFGVSLGSRELERLVEELRAATLPHADRALLAQIDGLETAVREFRLAAPGEQGRHEFESCRASLVPSLDELRHGLAELVGSLDALGDADVAVEKLVEQAVGIAERLSFLTGEDTWDGLRWLEVHPRSVRLHLTPLDVSGTLAGLIATGNQAWIFTSATLAIGEDFSHFTSRVGIDDARGLTFPSPYPVDRNGVVYVPPGLPQPSDPGYTDAVLEALVPLFGMTRGGIFILFTSHRALNLARSWFRSNPRPLAGRKLFIQGSAPRDDLLTRFRAARDGVLLGTGSFWEGVDVRGQALTIVAIDKLPFTSPGDPLTMARLEFIRRNGGNGFADHQLPQAVLALKQGAGRLLRDHTDYGAIVLCDPRVNGKSYGRHFLAALEPMPLTDSAEDVRAFFARHEAEGAVA